MSPDQAGGRDPRPTLVSFPRGTGLADPATTKVVGSATPAGPSQPTRKRGRVIILVLLALVAGGLGVRGWWSHRPADIRSDTTLVDAQGMAARYGIRVSLIAVTAAGGLVEFRYQVVDPDKADRIVHDRELAPAFVVEETGATLVMSSPPHHHGAELKLGGTYYFLLANAHSAVRRGSHVTLVIGDARLEHVLAQG
ncbi:MAG: hypothetical protein JWR85_1744 [Marmoricola sp.]|nr:hypothetical protein [Marmoricola sp.]